MTHIPATYIGKQEWPVGCRYPSLLLYNLLEPMGEHPVHSTVSGETIARHGRVPTIVDNQED